MYEVLTTYKSREFKAEVRRRTDVAAAWVLWWTDYVANEWEEPWASEYLATRRLAHLIDAVERDNRDEGPPHFMDRREWLNSIPYTVVVT